MGWSVPSEETVRAGRPGQLRGPGLAHQAAAAHRQRQHSRQPQVFKAGVYELLPEERQWRVQPFPVCTAVWNQGNCSENCSVWKSCRFIEQLCTKLKRKNIKTDIDKVEQGWMRFLTWSQVVCAAVCGPVCVGVDRPCVSLFTDNVFKHCSWSLK